MLKEKDKIFKNLYGQDDWALKGAYKRNIWSNTKEIIKKGSDFKNLYEGMIVNGIKEKEAFKILGENWLEFMKLHF